MFQSLAERGVGLPVAAEPYRVPDASQGAGDLDGLVAIFWTEVKRCPRLVIERGQGYIALQWCYLAIVAVYVSLNIGRTTPPSWMN
jgi:hypothetical protein